MADQRKTTGGDTARRDKPAVLQPGGPVVPGDPGGKAQKENPVKKKEDTPQTMEIISDGSDG